MSAATDASAWGGTAATCEVDWLAQPWDQLPSPSWLPGDHARLLVLAAHPDDEALGAGGLVARAAAAGMQVELVVATAGEASHPDSPTTDRLRLAEVRRRELSAAAAALGCSHVECLDLPDGELESHEEQLRRALDQRVGAQECLVVAPWTGDRHPDHEALGRAAAEVTRRSGATLVHYPVWLWQWGAPEDLPWDRAVRVDLDPAAKRRKAEAIACHRSQVEGLSDARGDEAVVSEALLLAAGREAEVFLLDDPDERVAAELDAVHRRSHDPWEVSTRWYERRKRALTLAALPQEQVGRALEVGCSVGALSADLARRAEHLTAIDVSQASLDLARERLGDLVDSGRVSLQLRQVPEQWVAGTYDLVVLSEVGYFLGATSWARLLDRCLESLAPEGVLLACHWRGEAVGWPLDGDRVHADLAADPRLRVLVAHEEDDFWLHVLAPADGTS